MTSVGFELSASQAALFARDSHGDVAVNCAEVAVPPDATRADVVRVLEGVVSNLEILRTTFPLRTGAVLPDQVIGDTVALSWGPAPSRLNTDAGPLVGAELSSPGLLRVWAAANVADHASLLRVAQHVREQLTGTTPTLDLSGEDALQFVDFSGWEAEQRAEDGPERRLAAQFWRAAETLVVDTDTDGAASAERAIVSVHSEVAADPDSWLTAWVVVLRRNQLATTDTVAVRLAVPGRPVDAVDAIGPFRRYVVSAVTLDGDLSLASARAAMRDTVAQADRFAVYAPDLVTRLGWTQYPVGAVDPQPDPSLAAELMVLGTRHARVAVSGPTAAAAQALAARLGGHLAVALAALSDDQARRVRDLDVLTTAELAELAQLGRGPDLGAAPKTVHAAFAAGVATFPDRVAIDDGRRQLTFAELDERSGRVARALRASVAANAPVGVAVDRSADCLVAMIAALKLGSPFHPVNPASPPDYVSRQLAAAGTAVVLRPHGVDFAPDGVPTFDIEQLANASGAPLAAPADDPDAAAYLMGTSGSTGAPKIVAVRHRNVTAYCAAIAERIGIVPGMRLGVMTMLSTDLAYTAVMPALVGGGTVRLFDDATVSDIGLLERAVRAEGIDLIKMTPSHLRALCAAPDARLSVPTLVLGGEALDPELCALAQRIGVGRVVNHYGPTETTIGALTHSVDAVEPAPIVAIGRPLPGVTVRIVDERRRPVPRGCVGELAIGGAGVSAGYHGEPVLTADRFLDIDGLGRAYLTGDSVRLTDSGEVVFLGRADAQVKIRGYRVELGEIEARLREHPGVIDAAVIVDPADTDADRLLGYVTATGSFEPAEVLARLAESVPQYMVPARLVRLDALPRMASGKVDRAALPALEPVPDDDPSGVVRAQTETETETALLAIWVEALGTEQIDPSDDFFRIGGHSLLATRIMARARGHFGVDLPLHLIFSHSTVRAMAAEIDERLRAASGEDEIAALLARVETMTEDEAERLLSEQLGDAGHAH